MELIKNNLQLCNLILDKTSTYEESTDAIVPDSYPDIGRIACAFGEVVVKDKSPQNDRVLVSGAVKVCVLYQPDGGEPLRRMETQISFAHIEEGRDVTTESTCFVRARVLSVDARAVNSRKISVIARLCFETCVYAEQEVSLTADATDEELPLEVQHETNTLRAPIRAYCRDFTILDDVEMPNCDGAVLVQACCTLLLEEARAMRGKAVLRGSARLRCILLRADGTLSPAEHSIPFTQIVDFEALEDGQTLSARFATDHLDLELHDAGVLSVGVGACALLCVEREQTISTIRDMYQTTRPLTISAQPVQLTGFTPAGELHAESNETVSLGTRCGQMLSTDAICYGAQQESPEALRLTVQLRLLFLTEDSAISSVSRTIGVTVPLATPMQNIMARDVSLHVTTSPAGEDSINVRLLADGKLLRRDSYMVNDVRGVEVGEPEEDTRDPVTLVLRYVHDPETLWEIAKSYRTTMRAIRSANAMPQDAEDVREQTLLIPICEK